MPAVSVIITIYRWRSYFSLALESVLAQSFSDYEIIVINDGSPDDVDAHLRPLVVSDQLRYIEQSNSGVAAARNRGLAEAKGEFIVFLDDDDIWPEESLGWKVDQLRQHPEAVLVYGGVSFLQGDSDPDETAGIFPGDTGPTGDVYKEFLTRNWLYTPGQSLLRASVVREIGGFDTTLWGVDDYDLYLRLAKLGHFVYVPRRALFYRTHPENASRNIWRMYRNASALRAKHLGRFPSPANWRLWLANYKFWSGVFGDQLMSAAKNALSSGDKKAARQMWWYALRAKPTFLRQKSFLTFGFSLR